MLVTDAYHRRCAITGENTLEVLQAAHIRPYAMGGPHAITNGLLLRMDFHKLFDDGLVSVSPDYRIHVSPRIRQKYYNGKVYYRLDDQPLTTMPDDLGLRPDRESLDWHFNNVFQR
ncbi:MAG TPA: HNH endonuclease, partial [Myxococcota bacterium]|nr:HNH endonuclease [Myxococcota bacterium]